MGDSTIHHRVPQKSAYTKSSRSFLSGTRWCYEAMGLRSYWAARVSDAYLKNGIIKTLPTESSILVTLAFRWTYLLSDISVVELRGTRGLRSVCSTFVETLSWMASSLVGSAVGQGEFSSGDEWACHAPHL